MSIKDNKAIVREWVRLWCENDHIGLGKLYDDDQFDWRISGLSPVSRKYGKSEIVGLMGKTFATKMQQKLYLKIKNITAEEDRVALEAEGTGVYIDGSEFRNFYHLLFTIRGGKVIRGRAYLDTWQAVNSSLQASLDKSD
jgi:ketosteroid isomerase-like protein